MDLSSLTNPRSGQAPGAYDNPMVETVVAFDENGSPYYATVPTPARVLVHAPQSQPPEPTGQAPVQMAAYQPVQPYYLPSAPASYSPVRDPIVCRLVAGTVAVAGCAFALTFVLAALAAAEMALGFVLGILALIWILSSSGKSGSRTGAVNVRITNTNTSRRRR